MMIKICGNVSNKEKIRYLHTKNIDSITMVNGKVDDINPYGFVISVMEPCGNLYEDWYWFESSDERYEEVQYIINKINN